MKRHKRARAFIPAMVLLLLLDATVTYGMLGNAATLDVMFGKGEQTVVGNADNIDATYYPQLYATSEAANAAATSVARQISDEGIVLLKNDGLLPLSTQQPLSPFGLRFVEPYYGGSGSSAINTEEDAVISPEEGLGAVFSNLNRTLIEQQKGVLPSVADYDINPSICALSPVDSAAQAGTLYEFAPTLYTGLEASCAGTVGLVFVGRKTGENEDASLSAYPDGTPHMLAITTAEQALIDYATTHCEGVVVVLCSASPMQIPQLADNPDIRAILWLGGAGSTGYASLADILAGHVNPSGRLPATYAADFAKDPTFANQDDGSNRFVYTNASTTFISSTTLQDDVNAAFHEFEEGIYVGYKYYETAFDLGFLKDYHNRTNGVVYPFGHGLSYSRFTQEIVGYKFGVDDASITVRVQNVGQYAGKEVVQLYGTAPYTDTDAHYRIEKSTAVLLLFDKTRMLAPGESQDITLNIPTQDMASYCYTRQNADGTTGCYVLMAGSYLLSLRNNSHDILDTRTYFIPETLWYDGSNPREFEKLAQSALDTNGQIVSYAAKSATNTAATNQFEQLNAYMSDPEISHATVLTRSNWLQTQPSAPMDADRLASASVREAILTSDTTKFDYQADKTLGNRLGSAVFTTERPITGANNGLILADLRGMSYDDPMWALLLDQLTFNDTEEIRKALFEAGYKTGAIKDIGKPASVEHDGPQGLTLADVSGKNWLRNMCGYPAAPVMAATWNSALVYDLGYMVGQEALTAGINGWYAPGLNILRSPFCGRASEYYSEDPLLSGILGAKVVSGAGDAGLSCAIKHFAVMDTEAHRSPHTSIWMTEQALREVYLKPFEIVIKAARKNIAYFPDHHTDEMSITVMRAGDFIMASDSALGTQWSVTNHALLTHVVRGEWGFEGTIISDMHMEANANIVDMLLRSGGDLLMSSSGDRGVNAQDYTSATGQTVLRNAIKNVSYTLVNSNAMQGVPPSSVVEYSMSAWKVALLVVNGIVLAFVGFGLFLCVDEALRLRRKV